MSAALDADVVVVGAGVAGALAAAELAASGVRVTIVEAGPRVDRAKAVDTFRRAAAKVPEAPYPSLPYAPRPTVLDPDGYYVQRGPDTFGSTYERRVGGTTWHFLGTALRLLPSDFELRSRYGVGVDWPISYADLEPWYGRAEEELGVAGEDAPELGAPRSTPYPMPPIPTSVVDRAVDEGSRRVGLRVTATPQARNSVARRGRPPCCGNASCIPICPIGAKYDATVHVAAAERAGARLLDRAVAHRVEVAPGRATVRFLRPDGSPGAVTAKTVVLAAHAIETPKLLLLSRLGGDAVGRHLMDHPLQLSLALAPQPVEPFRGPLSTGGIEQLRTGPFRARRGAFRIEVGNDGWSFPAGDAPTQAAQAAAGGELGAAGLRALGDRLARQLRFAALRHEEVPFAAGHIMGTCRMGDDPRTSVVDADLRLHGHGNCFVLGSSVFPTVGTANPTLTIAALSLRAVEPIRRSLTA